MESLISSSLSPSDQAQLIQSLYRDINSSQLSISGRQAHKVLGKQDFIYGEMDALAFQGLLNQCPFPDKASFVDLGSGSGKACCCAALFYPFDQVSGIEFIEPLHQAALSQINRLQDLLTTQYQIPCPDSLFHMQHGDIRHIAWTHANVVFLNACIDRLIEII